MDLSKSFVGRMNRRGPKHDLCGTPQMSSCFFEFLPTIESSWFGSIFTTVHPFHLYGLGSRTQSKYNCVALVVGSKKFMLPTSFAEINVVTRLQKRKNSSSRNKNLPVSKTAYAARFQSVSDRLHVRSSK